MIDFPAFTTINMSSISTIIYTYNEENNIQAAIDSAKLLGKTTIVVDSESTDATVEIAKKNGAIAYVVNHTTYVEPLREFGIKSAQSDWVFILDADERITKELAKEIRHVISNVGNGLKTFPTHYKVSRKNIFGKTKWLKHGGWWPDYQMRLINKKFFKAWPKEIHSAPKIEGGEGTLQEPLIHYFHGDFSSMLQKTSLFEDIESDLLFRANRAVSTLTFFRKFWGELYRRLFRNFGFLDGDIGIIESIYQAFSKTITYLFLYEKKKSRSL